MLSLNYTRLLEIEQFNGAIKSVELEGNGGINELVGKKKKKKKSRKCVG